MYDLIVNISTNILFTINLQVFFTFSAISFSNLLNFHKMLNKKFIAFAASNCLVLLPITYSVQKNTKYVALEHLFQASV